MPSLTIFNYKRFKFDFRVKGSLTKKIRQIKKSSSENFTNPVSTNFEEAQSNQKTAAMASNNGTSSKKTRAAMMTSLECPVCQEMPRVGTGLAIYGCRNGHLLCQGCVDKVQQCPICREKEIHCRNLFAERYIEAEFKDVPFKCKYHGCAVQLPMTDNDLTKHEKFCPHR